MRNVKVEVSNVLTVDTTSLKREEIDYLIATHDFPNPDIPKLLRMNKSIYGVPRSYPMASVGLNNSLILPRGVTGTLRDFAAKNCITLRFSDERTEGHSVSFPEHKRTLYPYQEEAVNAAISKQNCLIRAPTGSGKTTAAIAIAARLKVKTLVIVWSANLLKQWITRISDELGIPTKDIGVIAGNRRKIKDITVAMQQSIITENTLKVLPDLHDSFGLVICDEVQRFAAKTFIQCISPFRSKYRIGISADETRKDGKEFLIYSMFGNVAADISKDSLIKSGHILDVQIRIIPTQHDNQEYLQTRNYDDLLKGLSSDETRNGIIYDTAIESVSDGNQVFVLSHRREHCSKLENRLEHLGIRTGLLLGGPDNALAFEASRVGLNSGHLKIGVGTIQAIGQGLDIPSVSCAIVASPIATNRQQFGQVRGRVCRTSKGKTKAILYYLWDWRIFGTAHVKNLQEWNSDVVIWDGSKWVSYIPDAFKKSRKSLDMDHFVDLH